MRVPLGLPLGETGKKHREGETLGPGLLAFWGMGSSGNLLGEQGQGNLPAGSLGRTGKKGIRLNPWPLPKDLFLLDSLARATKPAKLCAGTYAFLLFSAISECVPQKTAGVLKKGLFTFLKLRFFSLLVRHAAECCAFRKQWRQCHVYDDNILKFQLISALVFSETIWKSQPPQIS